MRERDYGHRSAVQKLGVRPDERLEVAGDVTFGRDVVVRGAVRVEGPRRVEDGEILAG